MSDRADESSQPVIDESAAQRLLEKLRAFVHNELDPAERALLAALLAPGIAEAHGQPDVIGYEQEEWEPAPLPDLLVRAARASGLRIVVDGD